METDDILGDPILGVPVTHGNHGNGTGLTTVSQQYKAISRLQQIVSKTTGMHFEERYFPVNCIVSERYIIWYTQSGFQDKIKSLGSEWSFKPSIKPIKAVYTEV